MLEFKVPGKMTEEMTLGELILALTNINSDIRNAFVDGNHPRPETWEKYGGISVYNSQVLKAYAERQKELIDRLDAYGVMISQTASNYERLNLIQNIQNPVSAPIFFDPFRKDGD